MNYRNVTAGPNPARRDAQRGTALVAVVAYLVIVGILGAAFFVTVHRAMDRNRHQENLVSCRALADGGIERTLARLRNDPIYRGERDLPLGEGSISTRVDPLESGAYRIVSTGQLDTRARLTVEVEAVLAGGRVVGLRRLGESAR
jgi:type II secretory pathway pseudopilin PulG